MSPTLTPNTINTHYKLRHRVTSTWQWLMILKAPQWHKELMNSMVSALSDEPSNHNSMSSSVAHYRETQTPTASNPHSKYYSQLPGHHFIEVKVGLFTMNSWVLGSYVAVVSNPRIKVPTKAILLSHTITVWCQQTMTNLGLCISSNYLMPLSRSKPFFLLFISGLAFQRGYKHGFIQLYGQLSIDGSMYETLERSINYCILHLLKKGRFKGCSGKSNSLDISTYRTDFSMFWTNTSSVERKYWFLLLNIGSENTMSSVSWYIHLNYTLYDRIH